MNAFKSILTVMIAALLPTAATAAPSWPVREGEHICVSEKSPIARTVTIEADAVTHNGKRFPFTSTRNGVASFGDLPVALMVMPPAALAGTHPTDKEYQSLSQKETLTLDSALMVTEKELTILMVLREGDALTYICAPVGNMTADELRRNPLKWNK